MKVAAVLLLLLFQVQIRVQVAVAVVEGRSLWVLGGWGFEQQSGFWFGSVGLWRRWMLQEGLGVAG